MSKYVLSKDGKESGPFSLSEVLAKITARELELFDYVYHEAQADWVLLTEHSDITTALKAQKPKAPPQKNQVCPVIETEKQIKTYKPTADAHGVQWYVMKGQTQFGPFSQGDVVRMMQERTVFEFDYIWNASMKDWSRLAEVSEFSPENIKALFEAKKEHTSFLDRKHARTKISGRVVVHNNDEFWVAEAKEISAGGIGLYISNSLIVPGQQVRIHVPSMNGQEAFNAIGEVVSKKFSAAANSRSSRIEYGVRFLNQTQTQPNLKTAG